MRDATPCASAVWHEDWLCDAALAPAQLEGDVAQVARGRRITAAATRLQAAWRGAAARRTLARQAVAATAIQARPRKGKGPRALPHWHEQRPPWQSISL